MSSERLGLSKDEVDRAERREGINHVIIKVLELNQSKLVKIDKGLDGIKTSGEADDYIGKRLGFLAEGFNKVAPFSLGLLEIISIWSKLTEIVGHESLRENIAFLLVLSYAVQELGDPWEDLPRYFLETSALPPSVIGNKEGLLHVRRRAAEPEQTLERLNKYIWGSDKHIAELWFDFTRANADPEVVEEAKHSYEEAYARGSIYGTPLLLKIIKEFTNARMVLFYDLSERTLSALGLEAV